MIAPVHAGPPPLTSAAQAQEIGRGGQDCNEEKDDLEEDGNEDLAEDSLAPKPRRRQGGEEGGQEGYAARIDGASAQGSDLHRRPWRPQPPFAPGRFRRSRRWRLISRVCAPSIPGLTQSSWISAKRP